MYDVIFEQVVTIKTEVFYFKRFSLKKLRPAGALKKEFDCDVTDIKHLWCNAQ
jgi:hypothetical protein